MGLPTKLGLKLLEVGKYFWKRPTFKEICICIICTKAKFLGQRMILFNLFFSNIKKTCICKTYMRKRVQSCYKVWEFHWIICKLCLFMSWPEALFWTHTLQDVWLSIHRQKDNISINSWLKNEAYFALLRIHGMIWGPKPLTYDFLYILYTEL